MHPWSPSRALESIRIALCALCAAPLCASATEAAPARDPVVPVGYVEAYYQYNLAAPTTELTVQRGYDGRHGTFSLANVALGVDWQLGTAAGDAIGRVVFHAGHTAAAVYLAEPAVVGAGGVATSDGSLWRYVQEARAGFRFAGDAAITVEAGLFLSPIGPEGIAVRDNWNWSRSSLFFALPAYHVGARVSASPAPGWTLTLSAVNGWNDVFDKNDGKSLYLQAAWTGENVSGSVLYFTGIERPDGGAEGTPWRHLLDAHATVSLHDRVTLLLHADVGIEPTDLGVAAWAGAAVGARVRIIDGLWFAARGDVFWEHRPEKDGVEASPVFWSGADVVGSATATLDYRPHDAVSLRLEYRHDHADRALYLGETSDPTLPDRTYQDTLTLGLAAGF